MFQKYRMFLTLHKYSNFGISRLFWCGFLTPQPVKSHCSQLLFPTRLGYVSVPMFEGFCMKICTFFFAIFGKRYKSQSGQSYISHINKLVRAFVRSSRRKFYLFGLGNRIESKKIRWRRIRLKVGWSDDVNIIIPRLRLGRLEKLLWRRSKQAFLLRTSNLAICTALTFLIRRLNPPDVYQGSGVRFVREIFKFRKRKKWGVFQKY